MFQLCDMIQYLDKDMKEEKGLVNIHGKHNQKDFFVNKPYLLFGY